MWYFIPIIVYSLMDPADCLSSNDFRQERARLIYFNPKIIYNVSVFTSRPNRSSTYLTSGYITSLVPAGNNITVRFSFRNMKNDQYHEIQMGVCAALKIRSIAEWMTSFTDAPIEQCPIPPGAYKFYNVEIPPKNFPMPTLTVADYEGKLEAFLKKTKEAVASASMILRYVSKKKKKT